MKKKNRKCVLLFFFFFSPKQWPTSDAARLCGQAVIVWLLNMWEMLQGSSLSPDSLFTWSVRRWRWRRRRPPRQIHHLLDLSLPLSPPSSRLRSLARCLSDFFPLYYECRSKKKGGGGRRNNNAHTQTLGLHNKSFLLVRTQGSVKDGSSLVFFFF